MALKRKITKAEYDALADAIKLEYKADGEDFVLEVTGFDDPDALKRAKDREVQNHKETKEKLKDVEEEVKTLRDAKGDVATLQKSWQAKHDKSEADNAKVVEKLNGHIRTLTVDGEAQKMATVLAGDNAALLLPHIKSRLTTDLDGDKPIVKVLDKEGKVSSLSIDELSKEFRENKQFSPVIVVSKASGGGAAGGGAGGGGALPGQKKFKELNDQERVALYKANPQEFERLVASETVQSAF